MNVHAEQRGQRSLDFSSAERQEFGARIFFLQKAKERNCATPILSTKQIK